MNSINGRPVAVSGFPDCVFPSRGISHPLSETGIHTALLCRINAFAYRHVNIRRYFIGLLPVMSDPADLMNGISPVAVVACKTVCSPDD